MASYNYTFTSGDTVTPTKLNSARTVSEIVNADIKSDAAIAGTKVAPNFGSQNIVTTGTLSANSAAFSGSITLPSASGVRVASVTNGSIDLSGGTAFNTDGASIALRGSTATFNGHGLELYAGGSERMRINSSGNVGIGTSSPTFAFGGGLQVKNATEGAVRVTCGSNTGIDVVQGSSGFGGLFLRDNAPMLFATNNSERMRIDASGNVGINDASPSYRLDVNGDANLTGVLRMAATQVITSRRTGWAAPTGTATRTTFATSTVTTAQLAERVKALIDDLTTHGLIGA